MTRSLIRQAVASCTKNDLLSIEFKIDQKTRIREYQRRLEQINHLEVEIEIQANDCLHFNSIPRSDSCVKSIKLDDVPANHVGSER